MGEDNSDKMVQMPLSNDYFEKLDAEAKRNERVACRQAAYIIKAYYDGKLQWTLPGAEVIR